MAFVIPAKIHPIEGVILVGVLLLVKKVKFMDHPYRVVAMKMDFICL